MHPQRHTWCRCSGVLATLSALVLHKTALSSRPQHSPTATLDHTYTYTAVAITPKHRTSHAACTASYISHCGGAIAGAVSRSMS